MSRSVSIRVVRVGAALAVALVPVLSVVGPARAAGPGSLISGLVWADTNRDQVHQATEPAQSGVTVRLLASPGGAVVATTTTNGSGVYQFANVADGAYTVVA